MEVHPQHIAAERITFVVPQEAVNECAGWTRAQSALEAAEDIGLEIIGAHASQVFRTYDGQKRVTIYGQN